MISSDNVPTDQVSTNRVSRVGRYAPDFELPGTDGAVYHLARRLESSQAIAIVFLSTTCPTSAQALPRLQLLQDEFAAQGFTVIGISANDRVQVPGDDRPGMEAFVAQHHITFPYIRDVTQDVARAFHVTCTPEVFLLDQESRIRYQGSIDDSPSDAEQVTKRYLRSAVMDLLHDQEIKLTETAAVGTAIAWR